MLLFFLYFDKVFIFLLLFLGLFNFANSMENILNIIFVVSMVKIFIQDVIMGLFKGRKNIFLVLLYIIIDSTRVITFLYCVNEYLIDYSNSSGLSFLTSLFNVLFVFCIAGILFFVGDFCSIYHGMKKETLNEIEGKPLIGEILLLLLLIGFCWFSLS